MQKTNIQKIELLYHRLGDKVLIHLFSIGELDLLEIKKWL